MANVLVFGPTPEPRGGVSSFIQDLFYDNKNIIESVIDIYDGDKEDSSELYFRPKGCLATKILKSYLFMLVKPGKLLYLNFSTYRSLPLIILFSLSGRKTYFTLHNGEMGKDDSRSRLFMSLLRLRGVIPIALSDHQEYKFLDFGFRKVRKLDLYLGKTVAPAVERISTVFDSVEEVKKIKFLISGYPTKIYQHLEFVSGFINRILPFYNVELHCCVYGPSEEDIESRLRSVARAEERVFLYQNFPRSAFINFLNEIDVYVRPSLVDSYGLVVREALDLGKIVLASDVCRRSPGAYLFDPQNFDHLFDCIEALLSKKDIGLKCAEPAQGFIHFSEIFDVGD